MTKEKKTRLKTCVRAIRAWVCVARPLSPRKLSLSLSIFLPSRTHHHEPLPAQHHQTPNHPPWCFPKCHAMLPAAHHTTPHPPFHQHSQHLRESRQTSPFLTSTRDTIWKTSDDAESWGEGTPRILPFCTKLSSAPFSVSIVVSFWISENHQNVSIDFWDLTEDAAAYAR